MAAPITSRNTIALPRVPGLDAYTSRLLSILNYTQQQLDQLQGARSGTKLAGVLDANGQALRNLPDPTAPGDPVTLKYLEANALIKKNGRYTLNGGFNANGQRLEQLGDTRLGTDGITRRDVQKQIQSQAVTGTGTPHQFALWSAAHTIFGDPRLTFDEATGTVHLSRLYVASPKAVTNAPMSLCTFALAIGEMVGGMVLATVRASDGTDVQVLSQVIVYSIVHTGAGYASSVTINPGTDALEASGGTLTADWTVLPGVNAVTMQVTPATSLVTTLYDVWYVLVNNSPQAVTIL